MIKVGLITTIRKVDARKMEKRRMGSSTDVCIEIYYGTDREYNMTECATRSVRKAGYSGLPYIATHESGDILVSIAGSGEMPDARKSRRHLQAIQILLGIALAIKSCPPALKILAFGVNGNISPSLLRGRGILREI